MSNLLPRARVIAGAAALIVTAAALVGCQPEPAESPTATPTATSTSSGSMTPWQASQFPVPNTAAAPGSSPQPIRSRIHSRGGSERRKFLIFVNVSPVPLLRCRPSRVFA